MYVLYDLIQKAQPETSDLRQEVAIKSHSIVDLDRKKGRKLLDLAPVKAANNRAFAQRVYVLWRKRIRFAHDT